MKKLRRLTKAVLVGAWVAKKEAFFGRPGLIPAPSWGQIQTHASGHAVQGPAYCRYTTPHGPGDGDTQRTSISAAAETIAEPRAVVTPVTHTIRTAEPRCSDYLLRFAPAEAVPTLNGHKAVTIENHGPLANTK